MWLKLPASTFRNRSLRLTEHWEGRGTKRRRLRKECLAFCLSSRHTEELLSEQVGEHNKGFVRAGRQENVCMERRNERRQREKRERGETLIQVIACLFAPVKAIKKWVRSRQSWNIQVNVFLEQTQQCPIAVLAKDPWKQKYNLVTDNTLQNLWTYSFMYFL